MAIVDEGAKTELDLYHDNIVTKISTAIPDFVTVEPHYGIFNVDELSRRTFNSPAAWVAIPTFRPGEAYSDGRITFLAEVMVVIASANVGRTDAPIIARRAMTQVLKLAKWNSFGKGMPPKEIEGNELHYDRLDPQGLAMCVASWTQEMLIGEEDQFIGREQSRFPDFSFPRVTSLMGGDAHPAVQSPGDPAVARSTPIPGGWI